MIFPCIDLMDGKVVQLVQGRDKALEGDSPEEMLRKFAAFPGNSGDRSGRRHGARFQRRPGTNAGSARRHAVMSAEECVRRSEPPHCCNRVRTASSWAPARFTRAGINEPLLAEMRDAVGRDRLIVAVDSKGGRIVVKGWQEATELAAEEVLRSLEPYCSGFLCTYVDKEGMMQGTDLDWFRRLRAATSLEL